MNELRPGGNNDMGPVDPRKQPGVETKDDPAYFDFLLRSPLYIRYAGSRFQPYVCSSTHINLKALCSSNPSMFKNYTCCVEINEFR